MSIRPVTLNSDGSIEIVYDETGHSGTIPAAQVVWATNMDGSENHNFIVLNCPDGCGGSSTHPVSGGAAPPEVQQMFIEKTRRDGCPCGHIDPRDRTAAPEAHVRLNCNRIDGPGRWQIAATPSAVDTFSVPLDPALPAEFRVVYRLSDRVIVGFEPIDTRVGTGNDIALIPDITEYNVLVATDPAYLTLDGEHVVGEPPT